MPPPFPPCTAAAQRRGTTSPSSATVAPLLPSIPSRHPHSGWLALYGFSACDFFSRDRLRRMLMRTMLVGAVMLLACLSGAARADEERNKREGPVGGK